MTIEQQIETLTRERDEATADCAVMRKFIEGCIEGLRSVDDGAPIINLLHHVATAGAAISTPSGQSLLATIKALTERNGELVRALSRIADFKTTNEFTDEPYPTDEANIAKAILHSTSGGEAKP